MSNVIVSESKEALRINSAGKVENLSTIDFTTENSVSIFVKTDEDVVMLKVKLVNTNTFVELPFTANFWMPYAVIAIEKNTITDSIFWGAGK